MMTTGQDKVTLTTDTEGPGWARASQEGRLEVEMVTG